MATNPSTQEGLVCSVDACKWTWKPGQEYHTSLFTGTFLQKSKLPLNKILHLYWLFRLKVKCSQAAQILGIRENTAGVWYKFFCQLLTEVLLVGGRFWMLDRLHIQGSSSTQACYAYMATGPERISTPFSFMHISIIVCSDQ
jgi:hypothetical protein